MWLDTFEYTLTISINPRTILYMVASIVLMLTLVNLTRLRIVLRYLHRSPKFLSRVIKSYELSSVFEHHHPSFMHRFMFTHYFGAGDTVRKDILESMRTHYATRCTVLTILSLITCLGVWHIYK